MQINDDVWVTVRYRLFDVQGEPLEAGERELTFLQGGYGAVFPSIEEALAGQTVGFRTTVHLEPEDGFGDYDADLVRLAPRADFPDELEVGMTFEGVPGARDDAEDDGLYTVTDFTDEAVVLDGNHPLAGMALRFQLEVIDVREATQAEIEREREVAGGYDDPDLAEALAARRDARRLEAHADDADDADEDDADDDDAGEDATSGGCGPGRRLH